MYLPNSKTARSLSICPVCPVRPVSSLMERTSSQNWFWPERPCSRIRAAQFSRSGRPKRGNLESCGGKNVRARLGPFHLNWSEQVLFGRPERTDGTQPKLPGLSGVFRKCNPVNVLPSGNLGSAGSRESMYVQNMCITS